MPSQQTKSYLVYDETGVARLTVNELRIIIEHPVLATGIREKVYSPPSFTVEVDGKILKVEELLHSVSGAALPQRTFFQDEVGRQYIEHEYGKTVLGLH